MRDLPGLEPLSPALVGGLLTTAPPGKSLASGLYKLVYLLFTLLLEGRTSGFQYEFSVGPTFVILLVDSSGSGNALPWPQF